MMYTQCNHLSTQRDPNASRLNIGCVGSPCVGAHIGHVHFMMFVSISFKVGYPTQMRFSVEYGLISYLLVFGWLGADNAKFALGTLKTDLSLTMP